MEWYKVTKTIHGRKYLYWQKTRREGKQVRTQNKYIGPASKNKKLSSVSASAVSTTAPRTPEDARDYFKPSSAETASADEKQLERVLKRRAAITARYGAGKMSARKFARLMDANTALFDEANDDEN